MSKRASASESASPEGNHKKARPAAAAAAASSSSSSSSAASPGVPPDLQILPVPGMGDCAFYAILAVLLCPACDNDSEFQARLQRVFNIPVPLTTAAGQAVRLPARPIQGPPVHPRERTVRQFFKEFRDLRLVSNEANSLWLKMGPRPYWWNIQTRLFEPNPQYMRAAMYVAAVQAYMRAVLVLYRTHRPELQLQAIDLANSDTPQERARVLRVLALPRSFLSTVGVDTMCTLLGMTVSIRYQQADGSINGFMTHSEPPANWQMAHAQTGRRILPCMIDFVHGVSRGQGANLPLTGSPTHFEGVIDRRAPLLSNLINLPDVPAAALLQIAPPVPATTTSSESAPPIATVLDPLPAGFLPPVANVPVVTGRVQPTSSSAHPPTAAAAQAQPRRIGRPPKVRPPDPLNPSRAFCERQEIPILKAALNAGATPAAMYGPLHQSLATRLTAISGNPLTAGQVAAWLKVQKKPVVGPANSMAHAFVVDSAMQALRNARIDVACLLPPASPGGRRNFNEAESDVLHAARTLGANGLAAFNTLHEAIAERFSRHQHCTAKQISAWFTQRARRNTAAVPMATKLAMLKQLKLPRPGAEVLPADSPSVMVAPMQTDPDSELTNSEAPAAVDPAAVQAALQLLQNTGIDWAAVGVSSRPQARPRVPMVRPVAPPQEPATPRQLRYFSEAQSAILHQAVADGVTYVTRDHGAQHIELAKKLSNDAEVVEPARVRKWLKNNAGQTRVSAVDSRWLANLPHQFTAHQIALIQAAVRAGVTAASKFSQQHENISSHFLEPLRARMGDPIIAGAGIIQDLSSYELSYSPRAVQVCIANELNVNAGVHPDPQAQHGYVAPGLLGQQHKRKFSTDERCRLQAEYWRGLRATSEFADRIAKLARAFSSRTPCTSKNLREWLQRFHRKSHHPSAADQGVICISDSDAVSDPDNSSDHRASRSDLEELPPFVDRALPPHTGQVRGRNKRSDAPISHTDDISAVLEHFWESSGLWRFRSFRDKLANGELQDCGARVDALRNELPPPVSDEVRSRCIKQYNQYMDPQTPLIHCAACGIYEFNSVQTPLERNEVNGELCTRLTTEINIVSALSILELTAAQEAEYHQHPLPQCLSVMRIRDDAADKERLYHLHSELTARNVEGQHVARLCRTCNESVRQGEIPSFSLAAGFDFGKPSALGLPEPSLLETQLIACFRVFAHIIKLQPPFGGDKSQRISGLKGHTIVFPHEGPAVCAARLPNMANIHDSVSVMFLGTQEQLMSSRSGLMDMYQGVFQVRPPVVMRWLKALKQVGNPLYKDLPLAPDNDPCWAEMARLPAEIRDRIRLADNAVTRIIDDSATSDVSHARGAVHPAPDSAAASEPIGTLSSVFISDPMSAITTTGHHCAPLRVAAAANPRVAPESRGRHAMFQSLNVAINGPPHEPPPEVAARPPLVVHLVNKTPLNEYTENDLLLGGSYPHLFFLGPRLPSVGSVWPIFRQKLLRQYDQRFSRNHQLLFLLFNQMQRHAVARSVAARVRSDPRQIEAFHRMVEEPSFTLNLKIALDNPDSKEADSLAKRILPMLRIAGASVPFSAMQSKQALSKLIAYTQLYGLPSLYLTVSPSDRDQPLILRLAVPSRTAPDKTQRVLDLPLPALSKRGQILAENPVLAAEVFQRIMETMLKTLVGLSPMRPDTATKSSPSRGKLADRPQGILGVPTAEFFIFECQGRGTLHSHGVIWSDLSPALLEDIAEYPELVELIAESLDQVITAALPLEVHEEEDQRKREHTASHRSSLTLSASPDYIAPSETELIVGRELQAMIGAAPRVQPCFSLESLDTVGFVQRWQELAAMLQRHITHMRTCMKGKSGRYGCRMSMPQGQHPTPTGPTQLIAVSDHRGKLQPEVSPDGVTPREPFVMSDGDVLPPSDSRIIVWELFRPLDADKSVVSFNPTITAALACNTALYQLGSAAQAKAILFYLLKYITKNATALTNCLSALHEAKLHVVTYPSVAANTGDPVRTAQHLLNRLLNNISGKEEWSAEMASAALLGMAPAFVSADTWFCFIRPAIGFVKTGAMPQEESQSDSDDPIDVREGIDQAQEADLGVEEQDDYVADDLGIENNEELLEVAGVACPDEASRIYRNAQGSVKVVPQYIHYHFRGPELQSMCMYEWTATMEVLPTAGRKGSTRQPETDLDIQQADSDHEEQRAREADSDSEIDLRPSPDRTRKKASNARRTAVPFHPDHPMHATHQQFVRINPVVPILAGRGPPEYPGPCPPRHFVDRVSAWNSKARLYAEYMLVLFVPWQPPNPAQYCGPPVPLSFSSFCKEFRRYREQEDVVSVGRAECILNISRGLRVNNFSKDMLTKWRNRAVLRWGDKSGNTPEGGPRGPDDEREGAIADHSDANQRESEDEIAAIIEQLRSEARADAVADLHDQRARDQRDFDRASQEKYEQILNQLFLSEAEMHDVAARGNNRNPDALLGGLPRLDGEQEVFPEDSPVQFHSSTRVDDVIDQLRVDYILPSGEPSLQDLSSDAQVQPPVSAAVPGAGVGASMEDDYERKESDPRLDGDSEVQLNPQQSAALKQCMDWLAKLQAHESRPDRMGAAAPPHLLMLVHGGAGVGKSTFARALVTQAVVQLTPLSPPHSIVACAAPTGVAASLLVNGWTLHTLLGINFGGDAEDGRTSRPQSTDLQPLSTSELALAQTRLKNKKMLLIDEVSMAGATMFGMIDARLRQIKGNALPFGGMGIVLMGDFFQLPAVRDSSLPSAALDCDEVNYSAQRAKSMVGLAVAGGRLFRDFVLHKFTQQMRVRNDDPEHQRLVASFQQLNESPITSPLLERLQSMSMTHADVLRDPSWMEASIVVPTNKQRNYLLPHLATHFARLKGVPVLKFHYRLRYADRLDPGVIKSIYNMYPALSGYFVQGAPAFITRNINPGKGLANGTPAVMHSLSWDRPSYAAQIAVQMAQAQPGAVILVDLPLTINLEIPSAQVNSQWKEATSQSLMASRVVVPIKCDKGAAVRLQDGAQFKFREFSCEAGFVITFHKCQGRTMSKVVLDLNRQMGRGTSVTFSSLYVGLSRVRSSSDIRLFPSLQLDGSMFGGPVNNSSAFQFIRRELPLEYLKRLKPNADLKAWWRGFNPLDGKWSMQRVKAMNAEDPELSARSKRANRARDNAARALGLPTGQQTMGQANAAIFAAHGLNFRIREQGAATVHGIHGRSRRGGAAAQTESGGNNAVSMFAMSRASGPRPSPAGAVRPPDVQPATAAPQLQPRTRVRQTRGQLQSAAEESDHASDHEPHFGAQNAAAFGFSMMNPAAEGPRRAILPTMSAILEAARLANEAGAHDRAPVRVDSESGVCAMSIDSNQS